MSEMTEKDDTLQSPAPAQSQDAGGGAQDSGGSFEADAPMEGELTSEELTELRAQAGKAAENWDKYVRLNADFDNFKKRAARERQDAIRYANENLLERLIPVLDNFEMAMQAATATGPSGGSSDALKTGVSMIASQLRSALNEAGLEEINAAGQPFNPNLHEAVSHQESKDVPEGHVVQQHRKGYKLKDRLIRPATVVVAKKSVS